MLSRNSRQRAGRIVGADRRYLDPKYRQSEPGLQFHGLSVVHRRRGYRGDRDGRPHAATADLPLYGSWKRKGHNNYVATICFFIFDDAGKAVAMLKTPEIFQLVDDDNLTGTGTGLICDVSGNNCVDINSTITITGKRLVPEDVAE